MADVAKRMSKGSLFQGCGPAILKLLSPYLADKDFGQVSRQSWTKENVTEKIFEHYLQVRWTLAIKGLVGYFVVYSSRDGKPVERF